MRYQNWIFLIFFFWRPLIRKNISSTYLYLELGHELRFTSRTRIVKHFWLRSMFRFNSWNFSILEPSKWNMNLNGSDCKTLKIISNDTKLEPISWELNLWVISSACWKHPIEIICIQYTSKVSFWPTYANCTESPFLNCVIFYLFNIEIITAIMPINRIYKLQRKKSIE